MAQNAGTLAAGFPAGMELGPEYQVMGSTVYYGDNYSDYGGAMGPARPAGGPMNSTMPGGPPGTFSLIRSNSNNSQLLCRWHTMFKRS